MSTANIKNLSLIDTHAHLLKQYYDQQDWDNIKSMQNDDLAAIINVACDLNQSIECINCFSHLQQALSLPVFISLGIHPHNIPAPGDIEELSLLIKDNFYSAPIVAIGECGLDYHYQPFDAKAQKQSFIRQIEIAQEMNLPIIMHCRDAWDDFLEIILYHQVRGVIHSFSADYSVLNTLIASSSLMIGVGGIATFTKEQDQLMAFKNIPINRLLLETDSPYLTPSPFRGKKNNPYLVTYIARYMAELMQVAIEDVSTNTFDNVCRLFNLDINSPLGLSRKI